MVKRDGWIEFGFHSEMMKKKKKKKKKKGV